MDYSRTEANPPLPFTKVEEVALEDVVNYLERATTKPLEWDRFAQRVKGADIEDWMFFE
jgi:hypothetical protein